MLTPQQVIVVFEKSIPLDKMKAYKKAGLVCIPLSAIRNDVAYIRFSRKGLNLPFCLSYPDENISFLLQLDKK